MFKKIIKETIIVLLLTLAIILVLGVLLYEYVPANKIIPEKVSYTTPEEAKTELEADVNENNEELYIDYHIDSAQIKNYQKIQEYVPGRKNPFGTLDNTDNIKNSTGVTNQGKENNTSNSEETKNSETNTATQENTGYLPNKSTK